MPIILKFLHMVQIVLNPCMTLKIVIYYYAL
jgi:hypothetical protein